MRLIPVLLIAFAVLVSVGAISSLLQLTGYGVTEWYGPLAVLQIIYHDILGTSFGMLQTMLDNRFGITVPGWVPHIAALYLCAALAFVAGTTGVAHRDKAFDTVKATALGVAIPFAIPIFIWHVIRLGLVSRFARDNTLSFFAYVALVAGAYFASVWANANFYAPRAETARVAALNDGTVVALGHFDARGQGTMRPEDIATATTMMTVSAPAAGRPAPAENHMTLGTAVYNPVEARMIGDAIGRNLRAQMLFAETGDPNRRVAHTAPSEIEDAFYRQPTLIDSETGNRE